MREIIFRLLQLALDDFYHEEWINIQLGTHEVSYGYHLAKYFEKRLREYDKPLYDKLFERYSVDIEFNRMEGGATKVCLIDGERHNIRPDILLHSKGRAALENLLVVELKKEGNHEGEQKDRSRIKRMVSPADDTAEDRSICGTLLGVYLIIGQDGYSGSKYWYDGNDVVEEQFN